MKALIVLVLLGYINDLAEVICDLLFAASLAFAKKDWKIFSKHVLSNRRTYFFALFLPGIQALLSISGQNNSVILAVLLTLTVFKKTGKKKSPPPQEI